MSTDTNPRREEAEGKFAVFWLVAAALIYSVVLCLSYL
jgi:hypothetical protein